MRRTAILIPALVVLAACVALTGCVSNSPSSTRSNAVTEGALVGTWVAADHFDTPEQPFVSFVQNHSWSASDGCDRVFGSWTLSDAGRLSVTVEPHATLTCAGEGLPAAVSHGSTARIDGKSLVLSSDENATVTRLDRSTKPSVGPQGRPIGYWVEGKSADAPYLAIRADGTYRAFDGCLSTTGSWTFSIALELRLSPDSAGPPRCPGVDTWLRSAAYGHVQGGTMSLTNASGTHVGDLASH
jgi:heat shock protein HslJ